MKKFTIQFSILFVLLLNSDINSQWQQVSTGQYLIYSLITCGTNIFAGTDSYGIYLSTNNGINWQAVNNGIPIPIDVGAFATLGTNVFAGTDGAGVFLSSNNGVSWQARNNGLTNHVINSIITVGTNIFVGNDESVFLSTNNGTTWQIVNVGLPSPPAVVLALTASSTNIFAGTLSKGVFLTTNNGTTWHAVNNGLPGTDRIYSLASIGTNIFAGTDNHGVFLSTNNGTSWQARNNGLTGSISALIPFGTNLFAGTAINYGIFLTTNNGASWTAENEGLMNKWIMALTLTNEFIFAGTWGSSVWRRPLAEMIGINLISTNIPDRFSLSQNYPNPFNPSTQIEFSIPKTSDVKLIVYDILGNIIQTLVNEELKAGIYKVDFSTTGGGNNLSSGVYFYRLSARGGTNEFTETKKMILLK
jgi:photosystem II stability/assembly factor-like uncharacterized protein